VPQGAAWHTQRALAHTESAGTHRERTQRVTQRHTQRAHTEAHTEGAHTEAHTEGAHTEAHTETAHAEAHTESAAERFERVARGRPNMTPCV